MSIRKSLAAGVLGLLALALAPAAPAWSADEDEATPPGVRGEIMTWLKDAEDKLSQLAEATPAGKFSYRPGKGVRSTADVFMHVAGANFGLPSFWGVKPPEGFDFKTYESSLTEKEEIIEALESSFDHVIGALRDLPDADLEKPVELFGMKTTVRGAYLLLVSHNHEHLGQSIAYARVNGIVPPWTARQEAAAAAKKKAAEAKKD